MLRCVRITKQPCKVFVHSVTLTPRINASGALFVAAKIQMVFVVYDDMEQPSQHSGVFLDFK